MWWHVRQRQTCRGCGTRPDEWDPAKGGHRHAYVAVADRDRGCEVLAQARDRLPKDAGRGVYVRLTPNPALARG